MAHARYVTIATPGQHEYMLKKLQSREYWVECDTFQGYIKPQIAEVKIFDTRIKKEALQLFLNDLGARDLGQYVSKPNHNHHVPHRRLVSWLVRLFRKLVKHGGKETLLVDPVIFSKKGGWQYTFLIGTYNDPHNNRGIEEI